jgi:hypothetical protein
VAAVTAAPDKPARPRSFDITRDTAAFRRLVRTTIFGFLQDVAARDWSGAVGRLDDSLIDETNPKVARLAEAFSPYFEARGRFRLDPAGRAAANTHWHEDRATNTWRVAQMLVDVEEANDWEAVFIVALEDSRAAGRAILRLEWVGRL